jgi:uncharacterized membrane protein YgdD (TMEM256/DUF423 family)
MTPTAGTSPVSSRAGRAFAAVGALMCATAIALAAWAAHAFEPVDTARLQTPILYLFLHGIALAVFARRQRGLLGTAVLIGWILGCLFFSGSLIGALAFGTPTTLAPAGGLLLIASWLLQAVVLARR